VVKGLLKDVDKRVKGLLKDMDKVRDSQCHWEFGTLAWARCISYLSYLGQCGIGGIK
jgi:hypothetical protein